MGKLVGRVERKPGIGGIHIRPPLFGRVHVVAAGSLDIERGEHAVRRRSVSTVEEEMGNIGIDVRYRKFLQILGMGIGPKVRDLIVDLEHPIVARHHRDPFLDVGMGL